jgi:O-methyltransferase
MTDTDVRYRGLYLDLLKRTLCGAIARNGSEAYSPDPGSREERLLQEIKLLTGRPGLRLVQTAPYREQDRIEGRGWPADASTMLGLQRLDQLQQAVDTVHRECVAGDLMEVGVWRGGAALLMKAVLRLQGDVDRVLWLADSFAGSPRPDPDRYPADASDERWKRKILAVGGEQVESLFKGYDLLDDRVRFLEGWFRDTLPTAPVEKIALLHLDGDSYESTMVALQSLYNRVAHGGFVIVDDYGGIKACQAAVDDFRSSRGIQTPLQVVDWTGVFWRIPMEIL